MGERVSGRIRELWRTMSPFPRTQAPCFAGRLILQRVFPPCRTGVPAQRGARVSAALEHKGPQLQEAPTRADCFCLHGGRASCSIGIMADRGKRAVLVVVDVGGEAHDHVGDEAILTSLLAWIKRECPGVAPVAVSEDPGWTSSRHGIRAVAEPVLPRWADGRWIHVWHYPVLTQMLDLAAGRRNPVLAALLREVRRCSILMIGGGGNLTSTCAPLLRLRSLLAGCAQANGIPVVVTGQQVGPALTPTDEALLRRWLPRCALVGVRDRLSFGKALELGVPPDRLVLSGDDALDLEAEAYPLPGRCAGRVRPLIGLSLHNPAPAAGRQAVLAGMVACLAPWLAAVEADILMLPHLRAAVPHRCDVRFARDFAALSGLGERIRIVDDAACRDVHIKYLTSQLDFLVTTRFHGAVFALSSSVPVVSFHTDAYSRSKMDGLFDYFGAEVRSSQWGMPEARLRVEACWEQRPQQRARLHEAREAVMRPHMEARQSLVSLLEAKA